MDLQSWRCWTRDEVAQFIAQHCGLPQYIPAIRQNLNGRSLDELLSAGMLKKGLARAGIRDMHHQQCIVEAASQLDQRAATADASAAQKSQGGKDKNEPANAVSVLPTLGAATPRRHSLLRKAEEANRRRALLTAPRLPPVPGARPSARGPISPRTPRPYEAAPRSASSQASRAKQSKAGRSAEQVMHPLQSNGATATAAAGAAAVLRQSPADRKACVRIVATSKEYEELTGAPYLVRRAGAGAAAGPGGGGGGGGVALTPRVPEKPPSSLTRPQGASARHLQKHDPQAQNTQGSLQTSSAARQPSRGQCACGVPQPEDGGNDKLAADQPQDPQTSQPGERSAESDQELLHQENHCESAQEDHDDVEDDPDKGSAAWHARTLAPALLERAMSQVLLGMTGGRPSMCSNAPTESARSRRSMDMNEAVVVSAIEEEAEVPTSAAAAAEADASPPEANGNEVRQVSHPPSLELDGGLVEEEEAPSPSVSKSVPAESSPASRRHRFERGAPLMTAASVVHVQVGKLPQGSPRTWTQQQAQHQDQAAIVRIQALERARRARQEAARLKEWRHSQINAATKIQSRRRGIMARRHFQQSLGVGGWRTSSKGSTAGNSIIIPCLDSWSVSQLDRDPSCPSDIDGLVPMGESHLSDMAITEEEADSSRDAEALLDKADTAAAQGGEESPGPTAGREGRTSVSLATILDSRQSPSAARKSVDKAAAGAGGARMHLPHENLPLADDEEEEEEEE